MRKCDHNGHDKHQIMVQDRSKPICGFPSCPHVFAVLFSVHLTLCPSSLTHYVLSPQMTHGQHIKKILSLVLLCLLFLLGQPVLQAALFSLFSLPPASPTCQHLYSLSPLHQFFIAIVTAALSFCFSFYLSSCSQTLNMKFSISWWNASKQLPQGLWGVLVTPGNSQPACSVLRLSSAKLGPPWSHGAMFWILRAIARGAKGTAECLGSNQNLAFRKYALLTPEPHN